MTETRPFAIDVSSNQGLINWPKLNADPRNPLAVAIRAGISWGYIDKYFKLNWQGAVDVLLPAAPYHVLYPDQPVVMQADTWFSVAPDPGDWQGRRIIDLELARGAAPMIIADVFMGISDLVRSRDGATAIVYSRKNLIEQWLVPYLSNDELNSHYFILAQYLKPRPGQVYADEHPGPPDIPAAIKPERVIMQQTSDHRPGPPGAVTSAALDTDRWLLGDAFDMGAWMDWEKAVLPEPDNPDQPSVSIDICYDAGVKMSIAKHVNK
jgi:hypothetical protein